MSTFTSVSAAVLAVAVAATTAYADSVTIVPTLGTVTSGGVTVTPPTDQLGTTLYVYGSGAAATYTINYSATASFGAGSQFGSVLFGVKPTAGLTLGSYTPNNSAGAWVSVANGATNTVVNGSFGNSPNSLNQIAASVGKGPWAAGTPQAGVGITPAVSGVGAVSLTWNGATTGQSLKIQDQTGVVGQLQFASESSSTGTIWRIGNLR